jgi:hypothetical protein
MDEAPRRPRAAAAIAVAVAALGLAAAPPALAIKTINVTTTADTRDPGDGKTSLREAFDAVNADSQETDIVLAAGATYNLSLCAPGDDDANQVGDLDHYGAGNLTVSGNRSTIRQTCDGSRVINQKGPGFLNLADMTITGGNAATQPGGGVFAEGGGELDLKNDVVTGNHSGAAGGGVAAFGKTVITGSTLTFNVADELAGAVAGLGPLSVIKSTVSGNSSPKMIGGLAASNGLTLVYATVQDNSSTNIDVQAGGMTSFASVVGVPRGGRGASCHVVGGTKSLGYSFDNDGTCGFGSGTGDKSKGGNPKLRPQQASGGVAIIVPQQGSPLIDAIPRSRCNPKSIAPLLPSYAQVRSDQRGVSRPAGKGCDIGAIEATNDAGVTHGQQLAGSAKRDDLSGTRFADQLFGLSGADRLSGRGGRDYLDGGPGNDRISGGNGADVIVGGLGRDRISGGAGNDRIYAVDGQRDVVNCGSGHDTVWADPGDVLRGCEQRH